MEKRVVLVSHNHLAEGMAGTVRMIFGEAKSLSFYCLEPTGSVIELGEAVREEALAHPDEQTVVIADILGGSVCNQCLQVLYDIPTTKILAGMSLPLVLGVLSADGALSDSDLVQVVEDARAVTQVALLEMPAADADDAEDFF